MRDNIILLEDDWVGEESAVGAPCDRIGESSHNFKRNDFPILVTAKLLPVGVSVWFSLRVCLVLYQEAMRRKVLIEIFWNVTYSVTKKNTSH